MQTSYRGRLLVLSVLGLLTLSFLFYRESRVHQHLQVYQGQYRELLARSKHKTMNGPLEVSSFFASAGQDRCPACHQGIRETPLRLPTVNPLRSHPGKFLVWHDPRRFGCTSCHGTGGEYLDRCLPSLGDPDGRALNRRQAQASCRFCHQAATEGLSGADKFTFGLRAYRRLGCGGCHRTRDLDPGRTVGPPLDEAVQKLSVSYMNSFINDPQRIRPGTAMPAFFSNEVRQGAPSFTLSRLAAQSEAQVQDMVEFLRTLKPALGLSFSSVTESREAGQALFTKVGCVACHLTTPLVRGKSKGNLGQIGPNLDQAGARLSPTWVQRWLSSPRSFFPETRMPDFRLSAVERGQLTAYLGALGQPSSNLPETLSPPDPHRSRRGQQLVEKLGCAGCHRIQTLQERPPAGPDLDGFGDKPASLLDWGYASIPEAERTFWRWVELKLTQPLRFDRRPGVLTMPWQPLRAGELEGLVLVLRSLVDSPNSSVNLLAHFKPTDQRLRQGERWIEEFSCRQCHRIRGQGGYIGELYPQPADRPPSLEGQGTKVLPVWTHAYLTQPTSLRPWLSLRMPTPAMNESQVEAVAAYIFSLDQASYPFVNQRTPDMKGERLAQALQLFQRFQCVRCHLFSNAPQLKPGELAPDLSLSHARLRRGWIRHFITEPQLVMPGTKMPTLFPLADEDNPQSRITPLPNFFQGQVKEQIEALTDLNLWWGTVEAMRQQCAQPR